ncbi:hypothetical protein ACSA002_2400 [Salmonella phage vB_SalM_SA002]|nr:hypothetical protein ACSA002_2400 [Salmonella phage vB_SalM_SA002]
MGLNKKALKLAGFKRCGLGAKHLFKSYQMLGNDPGMAAGSMVHIKAHLISLSKAPWKYGKFPQKPPKYRYEIGEANLLIGMVPTSPNPIVKEVDADHVDLTIEFTAIKSGYEPINREMAEGMSAGSFPSITPKPSALRSVLTNMHVAAVATGMKKVWGKF